MRPNFPRLQLFTVYKKHAKNIDTNFPFEDHTANTSTNLLQSTWRDCFTHLQLNIKIFVSYHKLSNQQVISSSVLTLLHYSQMLLWIEILKQLWKQYAIVKFFQPPYVYSKLTESFYRPVPKLFIGPVLVNTVTTDFESIKNKIIKNKLLIK